MSFSTVFWFCCLHRHVTLPSPTESYHCTACTDNIAAKAAHRAHSHALTARSPPYPENSAVLLKQIFMHARALTNFGSFPPMPLQPTAKLNLNRFRV